MSSAEWLIIGKLVLTFSLLLGLPVLDLLLMRRHDCATQRRESDI